MTKCLCLSFSLVLGLVLVSIIVNCAIATEIKSSIDLSSSSKYLNNNDLSGLCIDRYSSNNLIYANNFENNLNVNPGFSKSDFWNSTEPITYTYNGNTYTNYLGNYWSDYNGSDLDGDGVGDTSYQMVEYNGQISENNIDYFPLVQPFENYIIAAQHPQDNVKLYDENMNLIGEYNRIQDAINASHLNYTIIVEGGIYNEHITINKSIRVIGISNPVINATYSGSAVRIIADNVVFEGFVVEAVGYTGWMQTYGIKVEGENVTIKNCVIHDVSKDWNGCGIILSANGTEVINNTIYDAYIGIFLANSFNDTITNNTIFNCEDGGILTGGNYNFGRYTLNNMHNKISYNKIYNIRGGYGGALFLDPASHNVIHHNVISDSRIGIVLHSSAYNEIYLNKVENCDYALEVTSNSIDNTFYKNCFINNTNIGYSLAYWSGPNYWNTSIGNYWSDYTGSDSNNDGIGDTPYIINASSGNIDYEPLMSCPLGENVTTPSLVPIYIGEKYIIASDLQDSVYLLNLNNTILWNYATGYVFSGYVNDLYAVVGSYDVYFFDINGNLLWKYSIGSPVTAVFTDNRFVSAASGMNLYLFYINGTLLWNKSVGTTIGGNSTIMYSVNGTTYIGFGDSEGKIYFYYENGSLAWSYDIGEPVTVVYYSKTTGVQIGGYIAVGGGNGGVYIFDLNGNLVHHFDVEDCITALYIYNNYVIAGTLNGKIYVLTIAGETVNEFDTASAVKTLSVMTNSTGEYIVAGCEDGIHYFPLKLVKKPDLVVTDVILEPSEPLEGEWVEVKIKVKNIGSADLKHCVKVEPFLDVNDNGLLDVNDAKYYYGGWSSYYNGINVLCDGLKAGEEKIVYVGKIKIIYGCPIIVKIDAWNDVDELNESNNIFKTTFYSLTFLTSPIDLGAPLSRNTFKIYDEETGRVYDVTLIEQNNEIVGASFSGINDKEIDYETAKRVISTAIFMKNINLWISFSDTLDNEVEPVRDIVYDINFDVGGIAVLSGKFIISAATTVGSGGSGVVEIVDVYTLIDYSSVPLASDQIRISLDNDAKAFKDAILDIYYDFLPTHPDKNVFAMHLFNQLAILLSKHEGSIFKLIPYVWSKPTMLNINIIGILKTFVKKFLPGAAYSYVFGDSYSDLIIRGIVAEEESIYGNTYNYLKDLANRDVVSVNDVRHARELIALQQRYAYRSLDVFTGTFLCSNIASLIGIHDTGISFKELFSNAAERINEVYFDLVFSEIYTTNKICSKLLGYKYKETAKKYTPTLKFNSGEQFYPISVEDFMRESTLEGYSTLQNSWVTIYQDVNDDKLGQLSDNDEYIYYRLNLKKESKAYSNIVNSTVYVNVQPVTSNEEKLMAIQYWWLYYYNPAFFYHEGDWEHVTVFVDYYTNVPKYVVYNAHGLLPELVDFRNIETDNRHPVVYVGNGSHASYPRSGTSLWKDLHLGDGDVLPYSSFNVDVLNIDEHKWLGFYGYWGENVTIVPVINTVLPRLHSPETPTLRENYIDPSKELRGYLAAIVESPVYLHAVDEFGRHVGYNSSSGLIDMDIPNVYYTGYDVHPQILVVYDPSANITFFTTSKNGSGSFNITYIKRDFFNESIYRFENVTIVRNETKTYINSSNPDILSIDSNGDGTIDQTLKAPVAIINASKTSILKGETITFNASLSYDPDGNIVSYKWDFGDNTTANGTTTSHTYTKAGTFVVTLTVTDNDGNMATQSIAITVSSLKPIVSFTYTPANPTTADVIQFIDQSYDPDGNIIAWYWNFGDGTMSNAQNPTHRYTKAGTYTVTLTVTDNDGNTNSTSKTIVVRPATTTTRHYHGGGAGGGGYVITPTPRATVTETPTITQTIPTSIVTQTVTKTPTKTTPTETPTKTLITPSTITATATKRIPGFSIAVALTILLSLPILRRKIKK